MFYTQRKHSAEVFIRYHSILHYAYHSSFDTTLQRHFGPFDIAVIRLEDEIKPPFETPKIVPCCLRGDYRDGTLIGLGERIQNRHVNNHAKQLVEAEMTEVFAYNSSEVDVELQLKYTSDFSVIWSSLHGNPLVHKKNGQVKCLIGIASFSSNYSTFYHGYHTVFTSAPLMRNWIWRQIRFLRKVH